MPTSESSGTKPYEQERQKRQTVLTLARNIVLVQIAAMPPLHPLRRRERRESELLAQRAVEAMSRNLDSTAYGEDMVSTGFKVIDRAEGVRVTYFVEHLATLGSSRGEMASVEAHNPHQDHVLLYDFGYWYKLDQGGVVNTLVFSLKGNGQMPSQILEVLTRRFNHCTVWANLRYRQNGPGQIRLDCVNLAKGRISAESARELVIPADHPKTYRLIA